MTARYRYDVVILGAHYGIGRFQNGGGYRYLELALTLQDLDLAPAVLAPRPTDFAAPPITVVDRSHLSREEIGALAPVFIYCRYDDPELLAFLRGAGKTLIYDSYLTPVEQLTFAEVLALPDEAAVNANFHEAVRRHNEYNKLADYFLVGQPEERLLKFGELISSYQVDVSDYRTLGDRVFPLPVLAYSRHSLPTGSLLPTSDTMVWNGGLWNHYSGVDLIVDAVRESRAAGHDVAFHFLYPDDSSLAQARLTERRAAEDLSFISLGLPDGRHPDHFEKQPILAGCRAFVLLYDSVLQLHLSLSMRLREVLLFEKPVIVSRYGVQGDFVARHGIGLTIDNTVHGLREAMERLVTDAELYGRLVANIRRLRQRYDMREYVPPIAEVIRAAVGRSATSG